MIRSDSFESTNGDRLFFDPATTAGRLTGTIANSSQNAWEDIGLAIFHIRITELALRDHAYVSGNIGMSRAAPLTIDYPVKIVGIRGIRWLHADDIPVWSLVPDNKRRS